MLSVFLCHLNRIIPPLWKSLTEHQKCQDQQPQNRLQKKAALLPIPVRDPMRIKMDRHPLRQISPGGLQDTSRTQGSSENRAHLVMFRSFFSDIIHSPFHRRINPSANRILSFLYFTHKLPACKSILPKITLHNTIC